MFDGEKNKQRGGAKKFEKFNMKLKKKVNIIKRCKF